MSAEQKYLDAPHGPGARTVAWATYFFLGAGMLAPWNALISAADYMEQMWPGKHVDRLLTVCYLPTCLVLLLATMKLSSWTRLRMLITYLGYAAVIVVIPIMDLAVIPRGAHTAPPALLSVVLAMAVMVGLLDGAGQGALYGDASLLPPEYTHAIVGGTASAGTLICVLRAITKAAAPDDSAGLRRSAIAYFFVSALVSVACFFMAGWMVPRLEVVKYWRQKKIEEGSHVLPEASPSGKASPEVPLVTKNHNGATPDAASQGPASRTLSPTLSTASHRASFARTLSRVTSIQLHVAELASPLAPAFVPPPTLASIWRRRWQAITAMFFIYVVTLAIFPGFLAEDVKNAQLGSWYPVILFLVFNIGDLVGKLAPHFKLAPSQTVLLICSCSRVVFFPAFFCGAKFGAPAYVIAIITLLLGLSNGYLTALLFARAAAGLTAIEGDLAANFMVVGLVGGLNAGAYLGWLWLLAH
ncbi:equilibrative nucleoside transporter [Raphidocelis subcapitata]|uniref:Equilibrative nucleoside transporter n=1 Tax=Raphidocelis subcapitata TaxID=307507 RepID=A0A2V0NWX9_9CHLO|nr:equilibrative nucleoside transporter [Raphidocelis subcapitata]|eukprot:GBF92148.1 equilibrative nucleoside transporter [Raphidocelis subcapitata]